jgi:hypothetical protein
VARGLVGGRAAHVRGCETGADCSVGAAEAIEAA